MNIYQPMMFVGLGGTGCLIGAELERRLRNELCGPDGRDLIGRVPGQGYLPYQLPACVQFVYADLNESELTKLRGRVVPGEEHEAAVAHTQHITHELVPRFDTYPQVALSLRTNAPRFVRGWLPPPAGEPRVAPLVRGAGQLPTVGRAALFETFRNGLEPAQQPVARAIGMIGNSGDELSRLGGRFGQTCDVFVAFSVAGGTGAGIFYDYLYLIGEAFQRTDYRAQIYPLVLMPSAFEEGMGGGRRARLNAGRALLDLFRLVDDQNGSTAGTELTATGTSGTLGVFYPGQEKATALLPATIQTAFLFSGSYGVRRDDLHRSIVSLMLSLVGTGKSDTDGATVGDRLYQSFADDFINRGVEREVPAPSGIGLRGVSTSLVASMDVPVDDLADIVASRLLARAVDVLAGIAPGSGEDNEPAIEEFMAAANLEPLLASRPLPFTEVTAVRGAQEIIGALRTRARAMEDSVLALEDRLRADVPDMVATFDPTRAMDALLGRLDLFRVRRVVLGDSRLDYDEQRGGVARRLDDYRREPFAPPGVAFSPPQPVDVRDRRLGLSKLRWGDPYVQQTLATQDDWFRWRAQSVWSAAWMGQAARWGRIFERARQQLGAVTAAFDDHAQNEPGTFAKRSAELYRNRVGVTYLLPPVDMEAFYRGVLERFVRRDHSRNTATEADVVRSLLGADGWRPAWAAAIDRGPTAAVAVVRERLKQEVKRLFTQESDASADALLPTMAKLLAGAARREAMTSVTDEVRQFQAKIHGLVPANFTPQGSGALKVLISYPAGGADPTIERFLREQIRLPREPSMVVEFRPINAESIAVVLFRTSMSITEVPELREILHHWSDALGNEQPHDFLKWRQRVGYDYGWLATTEEHRVRILHHLLCAMWNGNIRTRGGERDSPAQVRVQLADDDEHQVSMTLSLAPFEPASSWGSLLRAYEDWTLADDEQIRRDFCEQLMRTLPEGVSGRAKQPSELFLRMLSLAREQAVLLDDMRRGLPAGSRGWAGQLHGFWTKTFSAAMEMPFENVSLRARTNLAELYELVVRRPRGVGPLAGGARSGPAEDASQRGPGGSGPAEASWEAGERRGRDGYQRAGRQHSDDNHDGRRPAELRKDLDGGGFPGSGAGNPGDGHRSVDYQADGYQIDDYGADGYQADDEGWS
ncbi:tubulin-like doman-containing protein [Frankia sp. Cj3]|uniref:tubulin-like doman-containing protein n=1 Tax=Frankia sp. Cj3 TaxID=2880976 RepID=UPI001EF4DF1F|nr:tubulin-like doman-containing protein [Frankia sp. Cj3]